MRQFKRILLKLSGELLLGDQSFGIQQKACVRLAEGLKYIRDNETEVAVVIGGGNIFRGLDLKLKGLQRTPADNMGMLATLLNGLALQQALEILGVSAVVMTALECPKVAESYNWKKALEYLAHGKVLIFVGGTGNPYFTTDTAAALRASEIQADILMKATKVDGIYDKDPLKNSDAVKFEKISYSEMLAEKLEVMDATAVALCQTNRIPMFVFDMQRLLKFEELDSLYDFSRGTLVDND